MTDVFAGNLPWSTTTDELQEMFAPYNPTSCEVVEGRNGRSRGYGLVKFDTEDDATNAINGLNGNAVGEREMIVRHDEGSKKSADKPKQARARKPREPSANYTGTSVFVGNLPWSTTDDSLLSALAGFSPVSAEVGVSSTGRSKGWGTVKFGSPEEAEAAVEAMRGFEIEERAITTKIDLKG